MESAECGDCRAGLGMEEGGPRIWPSSLSQAAKAGVELLVGTHDEMKLGVTC